MEAHQVECVLDPPSHHRRLDAKVLHGIGDLILDPVGDEGGRGVLSDVADRARQLGGRRVSDRATIDDHVAEHLAAREVGHEAVDHLEQRGLA